MNFAVEKAVATQEPGGGGGTPGNPDSPADGDSQGNPPMPRTSASNAYTLNSVKTGDPFHMLLWSAAALASGMALLLFAVLYIKNRKGEERSD